MNLTVFPQLKIKTLGKNFEKVLAITSRTIDIMLILTLNSIRLF